MPNSCPYFTDFIEPLYREVAEAEELLRTFTENPSKELEQEMTQKMNQLKSDLNEFPRQEFQERAREILVKWLEEITSVGEGGASEATIEFDSDNMVSLKLSPGHRTINFFLSTKPYWPNLLKTLDGSVTASHAIQSLKNTQEVMGTLEIFHLFQDQEFHFVAPVLKKCSVIRCKPDADDMTAWESREGKSLSFPALEETRGMEVELFESLSAPALIQSRSLFLRRIESVELSNLKLIMRDCSFERMSHLHLPELLQVGDNTTIMLRILIKNCIDFRAEKLTNLYVNLAIYNSEDIVFASITEVSGSMHLLKLKREPGLFRKMFPTLQNVGVSKDANGKIVSFFVDTDELKQEIQEARRKGLWATGAMRLEVEAA